MKALDPSFLTPKLSRKKVLTSINMIIVSVHMVISYDSPKKTSGSFVFRGCFWEVWEVFFGDLGEVWGHVWEVWGGF